VSSVPTPDSRESSPAREPEGSDPTFKRFAMLIGSLLAGAIGWLAFPHAVAPNTLPVLMLDAGQERAALAKDQQLVQQSTSALPTPGQAELRQLYLAVGRSELDPSTSYDASQRRRIAFFAADLTPPQRAQLRAEATELAMDALRRGATDDESAGLLGSFPRTLVKLGLLSEQGAWLAPPLTIRSAYKARWNVIHERSRFEGLEPVEVQSLQGFVALHGTAFSPQERAQAAADFYEAHGQRSAEAYAVWLFQGGLQEQGLVLMERAHAQRRELRLRNMTLGMWHLLSDEGL
jgi:hypothetical protein